MLINSDIKKNIVIGCFLGILLTSTIFVYVKLDTNNSIEEVKPNSGEIYHIEESQITAFGTYTPISVNLPIKGPDITYQADLSDVYGIESITDQQVRQMLSLQGFAVLESDYDQFYEIYKENQGEYKQFITTCILFMSSMITL
ncbi:MAG: hypothetical protein ACXAC2_05835 [Candidatus Kariarchaeaceae archaeon]|jgi:hypothetical protein